MLKIAPQKHDCTNRFSSKLFAFEISIALSFYKYVVKC